MANLLDLLKPGSLGIGKEVVCENVDMGIRFRKMCGVYKRKRTTETIAEIAENLQIQKSIRVNNSKKLHRIHQREVLQSDEKREFDELVSRRQMRRTERIFEAGKGEVCRKHQGKADSQGDIGKYKNFPHRSVEMYDRPQKSEEKCMYKHCQKFVMA